MENKLENGGSPVIEIRPDGTMVKTSGPAAPQLGVQYENKQPPVQKGKQKKEKLPKEKRKLPLAWILILLGLTYAVIAVVLSAFLVRVEWPATGMIGADIALLLSFGAFALYAAMRQRDAISSFRKMLFLCFLILVAMLPMIFTMRLNIGVLTFMLSVLLLAIMANEKVAILTAIPVSVAAAVIARALGDETASPIALTLAIIIACMTAVLALSMNKTRGATVIASLAAGAAAAVSYVAVMIAFDEEIASYWPVPLCLLGSCIVSGLLAVGLMPVCESVFSIASEARLNELLNNNNPLLRRLMTEAPGTYQHSLLVANLAESAAEAIGANALLCRVAACYHDVGKLNNPQCFKENQSPDKNIHDELDPYTSAKLIIAHQQDGVNLLEKAKLPRDIIRIVGEHHGDSVMVYFYDKAKKQAPEGAVIDEAAFRYPSHKPTTKESAIIMLADCCEAAVRSMKNPTIEEITDKVRDVIMHKWDKRDSMLWDSPLSFSDIKKIEASFIKTFAALHHERIKYPDLKGVDVR